MKDQIALPAILLTAALLLGGCMSAVLAPKITTAPNGQRASEEQHGAPPDTQLALNQIYAQVLRVPVGPPPAELSAGVTEPGNYHQEHTLTSQPSPDGRVRLVVRSQWTPLEFGGATSGQPKGTIVLLHGFWMSKATVAHWAVHLAENGYRTISVDLRGHGSSTGPWITFGALEATDLAQLLDHLQSRGLAGESVGVLGVSYGASIGLIWAARDARVRTVVALEPYRDARTAIRQYARAMLSPMANRALSDHTIATATSRAARLAGFSWSNADVQRAVSQLAVPVLLIHGQRDTLMPPEHSRELYRLAPAGSRLIETATDDHFSLSLRLDGIAPEVVAWFDQTLGANAGLE